MSVALRVEALPTAAGVYLFRAKSGKVLYVGKAQNLKSRVRQYVSGGDGRIRIPALMERAADVEVVVTPTIKEALLLENELIKRHKPVFNVRLRDDKQYLTLRLDEREEWPRLTTARRFGRDGAKYFGPYTSSVALKESLSNLRRIFPLRSCSNATFRDYQRRGRPCIEYEMKRCLGPCCGLVDEAGYRELVAGTVLFLRGRSGELVGDLHARMKAAAAREDFEEAARLRDRIQAVERTVESQQIVSDNRTPRDVFGLARQGNEAEVQVLHVREGRVVGTEGFGFSDVRIDDGEVMGSFLAQYYGDETRPTPREVLTSQDFPDGGVLEEWLSDRSGGRVAVRTPRRGRAAAAGGHGGPQRIPHPRPPAGDARERGRRARGDRARVPPAGDAAPDRVLRRLEPPGRPAGGEPGGLRGRPSLQEGLPALPHPGGGGRRRLRLPARGDEAAPGPGRGGAAARPADGGRRARAARRGVGGPVRRGPRRGHPRPLEGARRAVAEPAREARGRAQGRAHLPARAAPIP